MRAAAAPGGRGLRLALTFALREMRGGLSGFYIFLGCIALGTAAIAGVNSLAASITDSIAAEGQTLLAGDVRFEVNNRPATGEERAYIDSLGKVAVSMGLRSMARLPDGSDQALVDVKAVDPDYPLYGRLKTTPALDYDALYGERNGTFGAAVAPILLQRLSLKVGDVLLLGHAKIAIRAVVDDEPDVVSDGFSFAPRLMTSLDALKASGLVTTGSLFEYAYKVRLKGPITKARLDGIEKAAKDRLAKDGWSVRTSANAAPALTGNITRFSQFLTLVGLTALIVGGVGVANAVRAFLDSKRSVIATFKCLGAPGRLIFLVYLAQIMMIALIGIFVGLAIGIVIPYVAIGFLKGLLPVAAHASIYPAALGLAALFGILTALAFTVLPIGRTRDVPPTTLFRDQGFELRTWPRRSYLAATAALVLLLAPLAIATADDRTLALVFVGGIAAAFVLLRAVSELIQRAARHAPAVRSTPLRLAIGNIHRPGALTPSVVLSLGLGLALLVALALIDGNLRREVADAIPARAPSFFFVDIQGSEVGPFKALLAREAPKGKVETVPMLRGRIVALNGVDVTKLKNVPPGGRWVLRGDRGLTYAATAPENAQITAGTWWDADYKGKPLVSFSADEAHDLGLKIGDTLTVNVLGRKITATIANFRRVKWETMGINFVMIFSPETFAGAPHAWLATLTDPSATTAREGAILRAVTNRFPTITSIRVKDAIDVVNRLIGELATAIRAASSVALIASVLVLAGALAAGNRARTHDAVVLKTLGATRAILIRAFSYEYLILGLVTAAFSLFAGGVAAWYVVAHVMELPSHFLPRVAVVTAAIALLVTVGVGLAGTWRILGQKAAPVLRAL
ncbi:MAG: ABC transporter permease [Pararhizobium sp.]